MTGLRAGYDDDGYVVVPGVFAADELAAWRVECDRLWERPDLVHADNIRTRTRPTLDGPPIVDRLDPVIDVSPAFDRLARDERLVALVGAVLGDDPVLMKDKVITKPPGTGGYGLHQDYMRWQSIVDVAGVTTACVALDDAPAVAGAIEVYVGQHDRLLTAPGAVADPAPEAVDESRRRAVELAAGDVLLIHPLTPHRSDANRSDHPRRIAFLTYTSGSRGDRYAAYYEQHVEAVLDMRDEQHRSRSYYR